MGRSIYHILIINVLLHWGFSIKGYSQSNTVRWFPERSTFPMLEYDLLEVQPYSGIFLLNASDVDYEGAYIPLNLGLRKSIIQWNMLSMHFDFTIGAASYTQFEIIRYDENTLRGGLLNTDFKGTGFIAASKGNSKYRLQLFHVSSHLGDDYIYRNEAYELNDKSVNYEQVDITYLYSFDHLDLYGGLGYVITPNAFRERFMAELGIQVLKDIGQKKDLALGTDIKIYEENDFMPDIHAGFGINFNQRNSAQLNLSIDTYYGNIPYSTLDFGQVFWIGLSTRVYM